MLYKGARLSVVQESGVVQGSEFVHMLYKGVSLYACVLYKRVGL